MQEFFMYLGGIGIQLVFYVWFSIPIMFEIAKVCDGNFFIAIILTILISRLLSFLPIVLLGVAIWCACVAWSIPFICAILYVLCPYLLGGLIFLISEKKNR